jgi:hypothetical protein
MQSVESLPSSKFSASFLKASSSNAYKDLIATLELPLGKTV